MDIARAMQDVYREVATPFKYGVILRPPKEGFCLDCPSVFRHNGRWYMVYVIQDGRGYETALAESEDLLNWRELGKILSYRSDGWDRWQADGGIALQDHDWGGSCRLQQYDGKYWLSYFGGALEGYETDPLAIGLAWTTAPEEPVEWNRLAENPVLHRDQADVRPFETVTLYKSNIIWDRSQTLGAPFVMFYNGKRKEKNVENIGIAVSRDMIHWKRFGENSVIARPKGICGDPQIVRIGELWVMFYFGAFWKPQAFDTFACSTDLVNWTQWEGPHLIEPSQPWDATFAHKPWLIKHDGVVYHFYCAVGNEGRVLALATSKDMR